MEWCGHQKRSCFWSHALPISAIETRWPSGKMCMDLTSLRLCKSYNQCFQFNHAWQVKNVPLHTLTIKISSGKICHLCACMSCLEVQLKSSSSVLVDVTIITCLVLCCVYRVNNDSWDVDLTSTYITAHDVACAVIVHQKNNHCKKSTFHPFFHYGSNSVDIKHFKL